MTVMNDNEKLIHLLGSLNGDPNEKIEKVANYLGYPIGSNPVNPDSAWKMLLHDQLNDADQAVLAIKVIDELTEVTPIREVRKLHEQVTALNEELGASFIVPLAAFIGNHRIVLYRVGAGNRDERLDLTVSSVQKVSLYAEQFNQRLIKENLRLEEDEFGFGYDIIGLNDLFKRELSTRFQQTIELYRKKISEAITGSSVRSELSLLVTEEAQEAIKRDRLAELVENPSYKSGLGCVVDTIILRQLLRRFLEGYYGEETFDVSGIALGIGAGTLESALQEVVQVYRPEYEDKALQKALKKERMVPKQITMDDLFMEDELIVTSDVTFKQGGKEKLIDIYERVRMQFEVAYGGDLFAGSVGEATNRVESRLSNEFPDLMAKLWADTSTDQYSFRYEDLPPELLQQQYEASMSRSVQIKLQDDGLPVVFYGDDKQEQKEKGAYYTDAKLVDYMVKQALKPVFETRLEEIRTAIAEDDEYRLVLALDHLLALKVVDMTCGGGSFLRGAFHWLTDRHQTLSRLGVKEEHLGKYPMLQTGDEGRNAWEKHLLLHVIYGVDIDYKALIICSQTITLSALRYWKMGEGFPELIGKTLIHQNALIHPVPFEKREEVYRPFKKEIKKLIELRQQDRDEKARHEAKNLLQKLQLHYKAVAYEQLGESSEMLHVESLELNVPEVFFCEDGSWNENGGFDVALGNPPWEIWKPNAEEFFERYDPSYRKANKQQKLKMEKDLYKAYPVLEKRWEATRKLYEAGSRFFLDSNYYSYQRWKVDGKYTGGDINLYKVSLERFYQVVKPEGYLSILIPGNIATDRGATGLRHLLLQDATLEELLSFENRKKIFELVDSRFKIALATLQKKKPKPNHQFKAFFYRHDLDDMFSDKTKLNYPVKLSRSAAPDTWGLLELREQQEINILNKLYDNRALLGEDTGPWRIKWRREFDMTNDSHFFNNDSRGLPLFGGRSINQYRLTQEVPYYVEVNPALENLLTKEQGRINRAGGNIALAKWHGEEFRIAYREIARSTDKRTLIASIVPPNVFLNNKLPYGVQFEYCPEENDYKMYYSRKQSFVIASLFNSFIMDFIIRRKVSSTVNMFYVYQLPVIRLSENDMYFYELLNRSAHLICTSEEYDELAKEAGMSGYEEGVTDPELRQKLQNQIDAYVADLYGLTRDELIYILSTFESANHRAEMRRIGQGVVEALDKLRREGRLEWPV